MCSSLIALELRETAKCDGPEGPRVGRSLNALELLWVANSDGAGARRGGRSRNALELHGGGKMLWLWSSERRAKCEGPGTERGGKM